jgi:hypothetical protein
MKPIIITVAVVVTLAILVWLRNDSYTFSVLKTIPFLRGPDVTLYDWGALALLGLGLWGLSRLRRNS